MIFPITITKRIILKRIDYKEVSERDMVNLIDDHMQQFGLFKGKSKENELFYMNLDPLLLYSRNNLRNVLFKVNSNREEFRIEIKTNTLRILLPFFFLLIGFPLTRNSIEKPFIWLLLTLGLIVLGGLYLNRLMIAGKVKKAILIKMRKVKE